MGHWHPRTNLWAEEFVGGHVIELAHQVIDGGRQRAWQLRVGEPVARIGAAHPLNPVLDARPLLGPYVFSETLQPIIGADDANHAVADEGAVVEHERFGIPRLVRRVDVVGFDLGDLHGVNVSTF